MVCPKPGNAIFSPLPRVKLSTSMLMLSSLVGRVHLYTEDQREWIGSSRRRSQIWSLLKQHFQDSFFVKFRSIS